MKEFENKMIKKGKVESRFSKVMKEIVNLKSKIKSDKLEQKEVDSFLETCDNVTV